MENQKVTSLIVMDLSAAFNTIDHQILLDVCLKQYDVEGSVLSWYDTYLCPRRFQVNLNCARSLEKYLKYGVAQGRCGGQSSTQPTSTLFSTLVDPDVGLDLNRFVNGHSVNKGFNPNWEEEQTSTKSLMESSLVNIKTWMHENCLTMNTSKTEFV